MSDLAYEVAAGIKRAAQDEGRDPLVLAAEIIIAQDRALSRGYDRIGQPDDPRPMVPARMIAEA